MSGVDACASLRALTNAPVLFLTAKTQEQDKLAAYGNGGDDFLGKPFSQAELLAKVQSLLRRYMTGSITITVGTGNQVVTVSLSSNNPYQFGSTVNADGVSAAALIANVVYAKYAKTCGSILLATSATSGVGVLYADSSRTAISSLSSSRTFYYTGSSKLVSSLYFVPSASGTYVRAFTAYDTSGNTLGECELRIIVPDSAISAYYNMDPPAGEVPDQPAVHIAEQQLAPLRPGPGAGDVIQNPFDLGSGKIGVQQQARLVPHIGGHSRLRQLVADGGRAAALPHDGVVRRLAGRSVPHNGGLPLIGNADARDVALFQPAEAERIRRGAELGIENCHRVMAL